MQRASVWGRDIQMQGSPWTLVVYREEFGGDLLSDVVEAFKREPMSLDDFLRFCWAMCRTCDDDVPGFEEWCRSFPEFDLSDGKGSAFASVVVSAMNAELFRVRPSIRERVGLWWQQRRARLLPKHSGAEEAGVL